MANEMSVGMVAPMVVCLALVRLGIAPLVPFLSWLTAANRTHPAGTRTGSRRLGHPAPGESYRNTVKLPDVVMVLSPRRSATLRSLQTTAMDCA